MQIKDEYVATLRARLTGDTETYNAELTKIAAENDPSGFNVLVSAAFYNAMRRRFGNGGTVEDVIKYVGDVRARLDNESNWLDPTAAEQLIRHTLGDGTLEGLDPKTIGGLQLVLLTISIMDEDMNDEQLETFLSDARQLAES